MIFMISAALNIVNLLNYKVRFFLSIFLLFHFLFYSYNYIFFSSKFLFNIQYGGFYLDFILFGEKYTLYFNSNGLGRSTSLIYVLYFYFFESKNNIIKITFYILAFLSIFIVINLSGDLIFLWLLF